MTRATTNSYLICAAAWAVPGAGHLWLGRAQKGAVFLVALPLMFATGLWLEGRLFPFELTQPLVALAAFADIGMGVPVLRGESGRARGGARDRTVVRVRQRVSDRRRPAEHAGRARCVRRRRGTQVSHLGAMVLFALFVSIVFSVSDARRTARAAATWGFGCSPGSSAAASWSGGCSIRSRFRDMGLWAPVVVYMGAIFFVSSLSDPPVPARHRQAAALAGVPGPGRPRRSRACGRTAAAHRLRDCGGRDADHGGVRRYRRGASDVRPRAHWRCVRPDG